MLKFKLAVIRAALRAMGLSGLTVYDNWITFDPYRWEIFAKHPDIIIGRVEQDHRLTEPLYLPEVGEDRHA